jgi:hypothetical protein
MDKYHIIIIILLLVIIILLGLVFMKEKKMVEKFQANVNGYRSLEDEKGDCKKWASYGECTTNWNHMVNKCPEECPAQVKDVRTHKDKCEEWKNKGYCNDQIHKIYMDKQCSNYCNEDNSAPLFLM